MDSASGDLDPALVAVLESAARLQQLVPDAILVGGSAAALYAHHRLSFDHDHVLGDLQHRFDAVLEALETQGDWVTNRVAYGKLILGRLGDIEAGVRQLIRLAPLEVTEVVLPSGTRLRVPTIQEALRVKAFLAVRRNQARDYLDIVAMARTMGDEPAAHVLSTIDDFYADQHRGGEGVASQVVRQLSDPRPADRGVTSQLNHYKGLLSEWHNWGDVTRACQRLADLMVAAPGPDRP